MRKIRPKSNRKNTDIEENKRKRTNNNFKILVASQQIQTQRNESSYIKVRWNRFYWQKIGIYKAGRIAVLDVVPRTSVSPVDEIGKSKLKDFKNQPKWWGISSLLAIRPLQNYSLPPSR